MLIATTITVIEVGGLVWLIVAWVIAGFTLGLGLPIAFWMFDRVPAITTLARN